MAPLGFLLVMLGLGLRLDTGWEWSARLLVVAGAVVWTRAALRPAPPSAASDAFVPPPGGR